MTEAETIAAGLSDGAIRELTGPGAMSANFIGELTKAGIGRLRFDGIGSSPQFSFSPTGLAVRQVLQERGG